MDTQTLRKLQLTQLIIAKEIKRICEENNIRYFMDGGTLLGAVRHKGFIPWDDDMDFGMKRDEYNKFLEAASRQLRPDFFLQTWETDKFYGYPFAKIRMNNTLFAEKVAQHSNAHNGIFVDIFPYDNCPSDERTWTAQKRKLTVFKMLLKIKSGYEPWNDREKTNLKRWIIYLPMRFIAIFVKKQWLIKKYEANATKFNHMPAKHIYAQVAEQSGSWVMDKTLFDSYINLAFEDTCFSSPEDYEGFLVSAYGNYMQLPPIEKRRNIHGVTQISFNTKE